MLRKYGYKVFNFNSDRKFNRGKMSDFVDIVVMGAGLLYFIEVKLGKDRYSSGQIETKELIERICERNKTIVYYTVTDNNVDEIINAIYYRKIF